MVLEGIVTTVSPNGLVNVAPMGPTVEPNMSSLVLRPFKSSRTYDNLKHKRQAVFHVTDDVELLSRAAVGRLDPLPPLHEAICIDGKVLQDTCRWYELEVESFDDTEQRAIIQCQVVHHGRKRDFCGFNRAKHAVIEAAILATRLHLLPREEIDEQLQRLGTIVEKTAGDQERRAFDFLTEYVRNQLS